MLNLDVSFGVGGKVFNAIQTHDFYKNKMKLGANGKIIISGQQSGINTIIVSRFNQNGTLDNTFGVNGTFSSAAISGLHHIHDLVILSDNSIIILAFSNNQDIDGFIIKITSSGVLDTSFGSNGFIYFPNIRYTAMELQSNGKIVLGSGYNMQVIRLNSDGTYDFSFGNDGINNDGISTTDFGYNESGIDLSIDNDGKIILIGRDYTQGFVFLVKYNADGSLDNGFDGDGKLTLTQAQLLASDPQSIVFQPDNKLIICSSTTISRLNVNGSFDTSFDNDGIASSIGALSDVKIQKDGKIVVSLNASSPPYGIGVARFNSNGTLDTSFDGDGIQNAIFTPPINSYSDAYSIAIQDDGKIIFGGEFQSQLYVVRLHGVSNFNSNEGKIYSTIGTSTDVANAVAIRSNGKIVSAGYSLNAVSATSNNDFAIVQHNADGSLDYDFGINGKISKSFSSFDKANTVAVQANGKILVAGTGENGPNLVLLRYNSDGTIDNSFGVTGLATLDIDDLVTEALSMIIQSDGKIVIVGLKYESFYGDYFAISVRFNDNGTIDNSFGTNGIVDLPIGEGYVGKSISIQVDGKLVIACEGKKTNSSFAVIRLNSNGSVDNTFDTDGIVFTTVGTESSFAKSLVLQTDGKVLVAGAAKQNSNEVIALCRYNSNGSLDNTFDNDGILLTNFNPLQTTASSVTIQPDGKIYVAGNTVNNSNKDIVVVKYLTNGALDANFNYNGKLILSLGYGDDGVNAIISNTNGEAFLAGYYHNGHDNDFALVKIVDCMLHQNLILTSPSQNYPNSNLPNPQIAKSIIAFNSIFSSNVTYEAVKSITLVPGFKVNTGAVFKTEIVGCSY